MNLMKTESAGPDLPLQGRVCQVGCTESALDQCKEQLSFDHYAVDDDTIGNATFKQPSPPRGIECATTMECSQSMLTACFKKDTAMAKTRVTWNELEDKVKSIIVDKLGVAPEKVSLDSRLREDLEADSLDAVELIMEVEEAFLVEIPDEIGNANIKTLRDALRWYVENFPREAIERVEVKMLRFSLTPGGKIEVLLQLEDGSWTYADGRSILPSSLGLVAYSRWTAILKELEDLINDSKTKEADLQEFFEQHPELIAGDDYDMVIPQAEILPQGRTVPWRADFILSPVDQVEFAKVLELKVPSLELINRPRAGHVTFSAKVWSAIAQLRDYSQAFDSPEVRERFNKHYKTDVFKPDLHLIAGRKWDFDCLEAIRRLRRETPVRIEDWDSVVDRLKREFA